MIIFKSFFGFILCCFLLVKLPNIVIFAVHLVQFFRWKFVDFKKFSHMKKNGITLFRPFGVKMFCGRQGEGKTIAMVWYLGMLRQKYPKALIYTNFTYAHRTAPLNSLNDLLTYRNGEDGVIFAIDEIQNEFSSAASKDFPESLLGEVTMQRKQRITILCTSQIFSRVAKPLREQCYEVFDCRTFFGRWTRLRCYDAVDYCLFLDSNDPEKRFKVPRKWNRSFIQDDDLRESYDTYEKVQRLSRSGFSPRSSHSV